MSARAGRARQLVRRPPLPVCVSLQLPCRKGRPHMLAFSAPFSSAVTVVLHQIYCPLPRDR